MCRKACTCNSNKIKCFLRVKIDIFTSFLEISITLLFIVAKKIFSLRKVLYTLFFCSLYSRANVSTKYSTPHQTTVASGDLFSE